MNGVIRFLGLLSTISLLLMALEHNYEAFAKSYNSRNDLCGAQLCGVLDYQEGKKEAIEKGAVLETFAVTTLNAPGWYQVTFRIYAGSESISGALLHVSSDASDKRVGVKSIPAHSFDYLAVSINADNLNTIKAELVL